MAITNFTGAALDQQLTAVDMRNARSTQLESDLLLTRGSAGLLPSQALFGAGGLSPDLGSLTANPMDSLQMGPEAEDLGEILEELQEATHPQLGAMRQVFGPG